MDAIARLDLSEAERTALSNNIPVAFAVTYLVGVTVAAWVLSQLAPKLLRVDLAEECRKLEEQMQGGTAAQASARREFELRAYAVDPGSRFVGRSIADLEASAPWRADLRRAGAQSRPDRCAPATCRRCRRVTSSRCPGRRTTLVEVLEAPGSGLREVDDRELLDLPSDVVDVVVTSKADRRPDARRSRAGRGVARRLPAADHAGRNGPRHAARHQGAAWRRTDRRRIRREHGAGGRGLRRGGPRHGRDRHDGRGHRHRRRARSSACRRCTSAASRSA